MTKTTTKTKTQTKCLKNPTFTPDDLLIPNMMIDISPWSSCSCQSPWLPCFGHTISSTGPFRDFLFDRQVSLTNQHAQIPDEPEGRAALLCHPPLPQGGQKSWHNRFIEDGHNHTFGLEFFVSGTFKIRKLDLVREGYNPQLVSLEKFSHRCILIVVLFSGQRSSLLLQQFERGLLQARLLPLRRDHQHALPPLVTRSSAKDTLVWF